jgi:hypothetical protein
MPGQPAVRFRFVIERVPTVDDYRSELRAQLRHEAILNPPIKLVEHGFAVRIPDGPSACDPYSGKVTGIARDGFYKEPS